MANVVVFVSLGIITVVIGVWGRRNAGHLVPASLPTQDRAKRERTLRRGAWACQIVGTLFVVAGVTTTLLG
ncbi:hypothetical protein [Pseudonocardia ammonioxydans]|uniref:hypothetical protein n=1 Tax=Pseudonocardia ammonioxydans TaxID=260086 RepID=UPI001FE8C8A2|nr:hypothetical protein [Pseudonocardia ammonioxydans]